AMQANGVPEHLVTGDADDYERFEAWAKTVPYTIGNPLYQWTHLELRRFFNEETLLNEKTARAIWDNVNKQLPEKTARQLIIDSKVEVICTTDDPIDSLEYHIALQKDEQFNVKVQPSFRPDKALEINKSTFTAWIGSLSEVVGETIGSYEQLKEALAKRIQFFDEVGGKVSDHALDTIYYAEATEPEVSAIFEKGLAGEQVSLEDEAKYKTA